MVTKAKCWLSARLTSTKSSFSVGGYVLNVNGVNAVRETEVHTGKPLASKPSAFEVKTLIENRGSTVVKVLYYKLEGRWFDLSWCQWIFH